jgi:hypothetical protein
MRRVLICLALICFRLPAIAEIRGVQAVLLHCWSAESRNTIMATLAAAQTVTAISSAPYISSSRCVPSQTDRLANIKRITSDLRSRHLQVHLILFAGDLHDLAANPGLANNFLSIWTELIAAPTYIHDAGVTFIVGSSLEDNYSGGDEAQRAFQIMANALGPRNSQDQVGAKTRKDTLRNLVAVQRFTFHRSPGPHGDAGRRTVTVLGDVSVPVSHEIHGPSPDNSRNSDNSCRYCFWSNDGPFVSHETNAYKESCENNCGVGSGEIPMTAFKATPFIGNYRLLWRPAYNLFRWTESRRNNVTARTFIPPKRTDPPRKDDAHAGADGREVEALNAFLTN